MKLITAGDIHDLSQRVGLRPLLGRLTDTLQEDFRRCRLLPGPAPCVLPAAKGEIALTSWTDGTYYGFKYEAHRPDNVHRGRPNRSSLGCLGLVETGEILLLSEMTLLTALRTAATAALGGRLLARPESQTLALLGTGAQSEFLVLALLNELPLEVVRYFDPDMHAMMKFARNLEDAVHCLEPCGDSAEVLKNVDVVVAATSSPRKLSLLDAAAVPAGAHIHVLADGRLESAGVAPELLRRSRLILDGRQGIESKTDDLQALLQNSASGRRAQDEITLLVSTGIGLQDFSAQRALWAMSEDLDLGTPLNLMAEPDDPKDLYQFLTAPQIPAVTPMRRRGGN